MTTSGVISLSVRPRIDHWQPFPRLQILRGEGAREARVVIRKKYSHFVQFALPANARLEVPVNKPSSLLRSGSSAADSFASPLNAGEATCSKFPDQSSFHERVR